MRFGTRITRAGLTALSAPPGTGRERGNRVCIGAAVVGVVVVVVVPPSLPGARQGHRGIILLRQGLPGLTPRRCTTGTPSGLAVYHKSHPHPFFQSPDTSIQETRPVGGA